MHISVMPLPSLLQAATAGSYEGCMKGISQASDAFYASLEAAPMLDALLGLAHTAGQFHALYFL